MKKSSLTGIQKMLIIEALKRYNEIIEKEVFAKNSLFTKEYLQYEIEQATLTLSPKTK
jgi:hypothetical protein